MKYLIFTRLQIFSHFYQSRFSLTVIKTCLKVARINKVAYVEIQYIATEIDAEFSRKNLVITDTLYHITSFLSTHEYYECICYATLPMMSDVTA